MSKLAAAISHTITGEKRILEERKLNYLDVTVGVTKNPVSYNVATEVKIGVKLETKAWISDLGLEKTIGPNIDPIHEALYDIKRVMVEEVFGEFRPIILEMRAALYDSDKYRLRRLLAELENQMFVDGI